MTVATTGMAAKNLKTAGIDHRVSTTRGGSHASYFPFSQRLTMQIAFAPKTGQLLGAQIAGYDGVDKRIDVLSVYIQQGKTIYDLTEFEQAYAPPYSSAKDPINMAGFAAENILKERLKIFHWEETDKIGPKVFPLDIRSPEEYQNGHIISAINVPLYEIRERMGEIPKEKNIFIYCEAGLRGYLAQRILVQNDFHQVKNLSGGYFLWKT